MLKHKKPGDDENLARKQKREAVRFAIREMDDDEWEGMKALIEETLAHPRRDDELKVAGLVLRGGESESGLDESRPELTGGNAKTLVYCLVDRIAKDDVLMGEVSRANSKLGKIPELSRERLRWALHRMPEDQRNKVLSFIPSNPLMEDSGRDRRLAGELFGKDASDEELGGKFGLSKNGVKSTVGMILMGLAGRPLARKPALDYLKRVDAIEPMGSDEVRDKLRKLAGKKRRDIIDGIPVNTWKRRDVAAKHKQIALEYLGGEWSVREFTDEYNRRHPGEDLKQRAADQAIAHVFKRIADEPQLVDTLRFYSGEIRKPLLSEPAPKAEEASAPGPQVKTSGAVAPGLQVKPSHAAVLDPKTFAVLSSMVGDVRAFLADSGLTAADIQAINLEELRLIFGKHGIKQRSATECVAKILRAQAAAGSITFTLNGLDVMLDALKKNGVNVGEIRGDASRPLIHAEEAKGKRNLRTLYFNTSNAADISDAGMLEFARPKAAAKPPEKAVEPVTEIHPMEVTEAPEPITLRTEVPSEAPARETPAYEPAIRRHAPRRTEALSPAPPPPEEKPHEPEKTEEPEAPELPPMSAEEFDGMLEKFRRGYKDRLAMLHDAGLNTGQLMKPFTDLMKSGGVVREEGEKILSFASLIRKEKNPADLARIAGHLEDSLLSWMEGELSSEDLPKLALYRVLAREACVSAGVSSQTGEVGKRFLSAGEDYKKFADDVPESLFLEYAETEDKYIALARALDPNLDYKLEKLGLK